RIAARQSRPDGVGGCIRSRRDAKVRAVKAPVVTPRDAHGMVDHDAGWKLWTDMVRFYPSGVHRRRLVATWVTPLRPATLLAVGCGPGPLLDVLHDRLAATRFTGVDNAADTVVENRRRLPWARFEVLDVGRAALGERFDVVTCSEVLE